LSSVNRDVPGESYAAILDEINRPRRIWAVCGALALQLDVNFGEDGSRVQKRTAAENLGLLRRLTLSLLKAHPSKDSIARKRFSAALDPSFLEEILRGDGILEKR
jgi:hypothetical protein